jgi:hypothetical protein
MGRADISNNSALVYKIEHGENAKWTALGLISTYFMKFLMRKILKED